MNIQDQITSESEADAFLYHVTHDLRAYVRAVRTIPDWIDEDLSEAGLALPPEVVAHLALLRDYAGGLDGLLTALTDLSRVGRCADPADRVDLWPCLHRLWNDLPGAPHFRLRVEGTDLQVLGPANDLSRLFTAVLANAIDHHDKEAGQVHVRATARQGRIVLRVEDDGPGIDPAFRSKVFKPLQTLKPRSETGHAGVGLAIARKVVLGQGGDIRATDPRILTGAAVEFDLPAAAP